MKKLFTVVLSVITVLTVASGAMAAFTWNAGPGDTPESFAARYKIEVIKLANESGAIGSTRLIEAPAATAANHASVYFYIRLTVTGATDNIADADAIQKNVRADVSFTALRDFFGGIDLPCVSGIDLSDLDNGVYYFNINGQAGDGQDPATWFLPITGNLANSSYSRAAIEGRCLDSATTRAYAKVYSKRAFTDRLASGDFGPVRFACGGYWILVAQEEGLIYFADYDYKNTVIFTRNKSTGQITKVAVGAGNTDANFVVGLFTYLGFCGSDVEAGRIYMTDDNLRAAFGFDFQGESFITWETSPVAIILDPAIGII